MAEEVFHAKPGCPDHYRGVVERHVATFPPTWRVPPINGEVFPSFNACLDRLQGWAFMEGFAVVTRGGGTKKIPSIRYQCIHHSAETRNTRGLENHIEKDSEGKII
ncbi:MAG: hypothetical protein Q9187_009514, partial [Circinaria calcarea]